jgi:hypothetical protein
MEAEFEKFIAALCVAMSVGFALGYGIRAFISRRRRAYERARAHW